MKCARCGAEFFQRHGNQRHCSPRCREKHAQSRYQRLPHRACVWCGALFDVLHGWQLYCSKKCSRQAYLWCERHGLAYRWWPGKYERVEG